MTRTCITCGRTVDARDAKRKSNRCKACDAIRSAWGVCRRAGYPVIDYNSILWSPPSSHRQCMVCGAVMPLVKFEIVRQKHRRVCVRCVAANQYLTPVSNEIERDGEWYATATDRREQALLAKVIDTWCGTDDEWEMFVRRNARRYAR